MCACVHISQLEFSIYVYINGYIHLNIREGHIDTHTYRLINMHVDTASYVHMCTYADTHVHVNVSRHKHGHLPCINDTDKTKIKAYDVQECMHACTYVHIHMHTHLSISRA